MAHPTETARQQFVDQATPLVKKALSTFGSREFSLGELSTAVRDLNPDLDGRIAIGMGAVVDATDALVDEKTLIETEHEVNPTKNNHTIGVPTWRSVTYHRADRPQDPSIEH
jgi:hypothetical protein